ncbi:MAG: acyl-CoA dehydrogenase family protein [Sphingobium sp.]
MDLRWSDADLAFRDEVRAFFATALTDEIRTAGQRMTSVYAEHHIQMQWHKLLHARGWAAPAWPVRYGGCGWDATRRYIFARERIMAGAPPLSPMSMEQVPFVLMKFGSEEQKARFLPATLAGDLSWCQGYSEPGSGSDLASLQMRGVLDGEHLVCNGSKIWVTHAHQADWMFCLVRTSQLDKPQKGISFVLIDMKSPGIEVRPITMLSGEHIQNQIFFDDVRVPVANVVGQIDQGWTVAKYLLEFERGGQSYSAEADVALRKIEESSERAPGESGGRLRDDPLFAARLASARIRTTMMQMLEFRLLSSLASGESVGAEASMLKVIGTELSQHLTELALDVAGPYGRAYQPQATSPGGEVRLPHAAEGFVGPREAAIAPLRYLNDRAGSIYAGSNEIQRNILAKAALGL